MALVLADRVKETTTSTGTTAITLAGAATGYQTFSSAVGNANTTYYTIADQTGANWEVGIGTYTTSGNTLSRDTVLASSNAGSIVTFTSGTKDVFVTYPAEQALYTGGPLGTPSSGTLTNATGYTYANLSGTVPTWNQNTTGTAAGLSATLAIASGGTNSTATPTAGGVGYGTGTAHAFTAAGTAGQVLTSNGAAAPTWATASGGGGALTIVNTAVAYNVTATDLGKIINCTSGTFTVSLTAAATLGSGFTCIIKNSGTNNLITVDPNGAETINGYTTWAISPSQSITLVCNGTNFILTSAPPTMYDEKVFNGAYVRPTATANEGIAIGNGGIASGAAAFAFRGTASNTYAIAFGNGTLASSLYSTAFGQGSGAIAAQAVTGAGAMALGGSYASGIDSFAAGIGNNTSSYGATGTNSLAIGQAGRSSGNQSTSIGIPYNGSGNVSSGNGSYTFGDSCTASGNASFAFGSQAKSAQYGKYSYASGGGVAQHGKIVLSAATTTTTAVALTSDAGVGGGAASTTNQLILASGQAMAISGTLIAKQTASGNMAGWTITGIVSNNAGTMAVSGLALTAIGTDSIGLGAAPTIAVDNTNKGVTITSGYKAATNIRWVATVNTSEVLYA